MSIEGIRVVRGPDWSLGDVDGGEGHVGTVTKVKADLSVEVQWDMGKTTTCRTGKGNKCDLRVLDSAPAGLRHINIMCNASDCKQSNFAGTRWHCSQCSDFDLCSTCYFKEKHSLQHNFFRIDAPGMDRVLQQKRYTSERLRSWGIFEDATVKRGPDWHYSNQDGGKGKVGTVVSTKQLLDSGIHVGDRNLVAVRWQNNNRNMYRLGDDGKVDVLCVEAAHGTDYYKEHLLPLSDSNKYPQDNYVLLKENDNIPLMFAVFLVKCPVLAAAIGYMLRSGDEINQTGHVMLYREYYFSEYYLQQL